MTWLIHATGWQKVTHPTAANEAERADKHRTLEGTAFTLEGTAVRAWREDNCPDG